MSFRAFGTDFQMDTEIFDWCRIDGFEIKTAIGSDEFVISANKEGLLSLAKHLTALADGVPGDHIHYDVHNSLEEGSADLIIEKALPEDNDPDEDIHDPCLRFQR